MKRIFISAFVVILVVALTLPVIWVSAAITGVGTISDPGHPAGRSPQLPYAGAATPVQVSPPTSVLAEAYTSNTEIRVFDEQQGFTLPSPLTVDQTNDSLTSSAVIPAGTVVNSHFIHLDNVGKTNGVRGLGTVTFDGPIIGVITQDSTLFASHPILGAPGTTYATTGQYVGLEQGTGGVGDYPGRNWTQQDIIWISGNTITLDLQVFNIFDQLRVITEPVFAGFVTGGGNIKNSKKSAWTFGGNVGVTQGGQIVGQFQINDHNGKESWHGHNTFTSLVLSGGPTWSPPASYDVATFIGTFTSNKGNTKYLMVEIWDDQEPGRDYDWITVKESTDGGTTWTTWFVGNPISGGNFQLHDGFKD